VCDVRVIVYPDGKLELTQTASGAVGVRVLGADGEASWAPLTEVAEEVVTQSGVRYHCLTGGAERAQDGPGDAGAGNGGGDAAQALVGRYRRALARAQADLQAAQAEADGLRSQLADVGAGVATAGGALVALPRAVELLPPADGFGEVPPVVRILRRAPVNVLWGIALGSGAMLDSTWLWCVGVAAGLAGLGTVIESVIRARGASLAWRPVRDPAGRLRVREGISGHVEVACRRGEAQSWRAAAGFFAVGPEAAAPEEGRRAGRARAPFWAPSLGARDRASRPLPSTPGRAM
jgi:hypothetical protein